METSEFAFHKVQICLQIMQNGLKDCLGIRDYDIFFLHALFLLIIRYAEETSHGQSWQIICPAIRGKRK